MIATVILAAGASSRMGQAKQLLKVHDKYILEDLYNNLKSLSDDVFVISGCYYQLMSETFPKMQILRNKNWSIGMGSSIAFAVKNLQTQYSHILFSTCDQFLVKKKHYEKLINTSNQHPKKIIASMYNNSFGIPVIFPQQFYSELVLLTNKNFGAKNIIRKYQNQTICIPCNDASIDVDTPIDLKKYLDH